MLPSRLCLGFLHPFAQRVLLTDKGESQRLTQLEIIPANWACLICESPLHLTSCCFSLMDKVHNCNHMHARMQIATQFQLVGSGVGDVWEDQHGGRKLKSWVRWNFLRQTSLQMGKREGGNGKIEPSGTLGLWDQMIHYHHHHYPHHHHHYCTSHSLNHALSSALLHYYHIFYDHLCPEELHVGHVASERSAPPTSVGSVGMPGHSGFWELVDRKRSVKFYRTVQCLI